VKRLLLAAATAAAVALPVTSAAANPICDLEHCILRGVCERVTCEPPVVECVVLVYVTACP
jgi:hypothetical protein